jgi:nicotinamide-nucleotide amidase
MIKKIYFLAYMEENLKLLRCKIQEHSFMKLAELGKILTAKKLRLTTAESCTGGMVAAAITSIAGSSKWFERGFVTYSNDSKQEMLGIKSEVLEKFGAVSEETARAMAEGALTHSHAQISLAITGIAGPEGGTKDKPVGTVCFAWSICLRKQNETPQFEIVTATRHFSGRRNTVRKQAVKFALEQLEKFLEL